MSDCEIEIKELMSQLLGLGRRIDELLNEIDYSKFLNLENEIDELLEVVDYVDNRSEALKCALWNIQEMITKN